MTQQEVYQVLKKKDKWMTSDEIRKITKQCRSSLSQNLRKLYQSGYLMKKPKKDTLFMLYRVRI